MDAWQCDGSEDSTRDHQPTWRGRATLAGARRLVCAIGLIAACVSCSTPEDDPFLDEVSGDKRAGQITTTTITSDLLEARRYDVGDCVVYDGSDRRFVSAGGRTVTRVVNCSEPHLLEITGNLQLADRRDYPTDEEWDDVLRQDVASCKRFAETYLGGPVDPSGRFRLTGIVPSAAYWAEGSRRVWCALTAARDSLDGALGDLVTSRGTARGQDQTALYGAGFCTVRGRVLPGSPNCVAGDRRDRGL